jgi:hypothetical protein
MIHFELKEIYTDRIVLFDQVAHPPAQATILHHRMANLARSPSKSSAPRSSRKPSRNPSRDARKKSDPIGKSTNGTKLSNREKPAIEVALSTSSAPSLVFKYRNAALVDLFPPSGVTLVNQAVAAVIKETLSQNRAPKTFGAKTWCRLLSNLRFDE